MQLKRLMLPASNVSETHIDFNGDQQSRPRKRRNFPVTPDPQAEIVALSPKSLMATNNFICEICKKGFQRDQNLQLHRRGHDLPWKLKQKTRNSEARKRIYICPEASCVHHHPSRALGDLTGIKKHFSRKHGEKKWKCDKCSKKYAVHSDWKAHVKTCGTREYRCDCGIMFSRKDSFITHRAFCVALAEESARYFANNEIDLHADNFYSGHSSLSSNVFQQTGACFDMSSCGLLKTKKADMSCKSWTEETSNKSGVEVVAARWERVNVTATPNSKSSDEKLQQSICFGYKVHDPQGNDEIKWFRLAEAEQPCAVSKDVDLSISPNDSNTNQLHMVEVECTTNCSCSPGKLHPRSRTRELLLSPSENLQFHGV